MTSHKFQLQNIHVWRGFSSISGAEMRLAFVAFVLVTFIATCFHARAADVAKAELDRLKEYLENVEFMEDEDALNSLAGEKAFISK